MPVDKAWPIVRPRPGRKTWHQFEIKMAPKGRTLCSKKHWPEKGKEGLRRFDGTKREADREDGATAKVEKEKGRVYARHGGCWERARRKKIKVSISTVGGLGVGGGWKSAMCFTRHGIIRKKKVSVYAQKKGAGKALTTTQKY